MPLQVPWQRAPLATFASAFKPLLLPQLKPWGARGSQPTSQSGRQTGKQDNERRAVVVTAAALPAERVSECLPLGFASYQKRPKASRLALPFPAPRPIASPLHGVLHKNHRLTSAEGHKLRDAGGSRRIWKSRVSALTACEPPRAAFDAATAFAPTHHPVHSPFSHRCSVHPIRLDALLALLPDTYSAALNVALVVAATLGCHAGPSGLWASSEKVAKATGVR